jgi:hypothetical protein
MLQLNKGIKIMVKKVNENLLRDEKTNSLIAETLLKDYGIEERDFDIFLVSKGLEADDVYRDIVEIFVEKGYNNVRCYLDWIKNNVEDIDRYSNEMPEEIKVSDIERNQEKLGVISNFLIYGIFIWTLINVIIWLFR